MKARKNIALIGSPVPEEFIRLSGEGKPYHLKKIFTADGQLSGSLKENFPDSELVLRVDDIALDDTIDLVVVAADHIRFAREAMDAGKAVRIFG